MAASASRWIVACSAPSGALGLSLPEGGRRPATAKGAVPAAPPDWPEANLAPGPGEEGVSSPRPLKTAGAGGPKGNKCPPAPAWPHLPWLHQGPCPCAHLPGWKALTVQTRRGAPNPRAEASRSTPLNLLLSRGAGRGRAVWRSLKFSVYPTQSLPVSRPTDLGPSWQKGARHPRPRR